MTLSILDTIYLGIMGCTGLSITGLFIHFLYMGIKSEREFKKITQQND